MTERTVLREIFPDAVLLLCVFHVKRSFSREVTIFWLGATSENR